MRKGWVGQQAREALRMQVPKLDLAAERSCQWMSRGLEEKIRKSRNMARTNKAEQFSFDRLAPQDLL
jgi:hypothetical protein